ncbi:P-loop containing nucleoside triphosphate hydrolase [Vibrio phage 1.121.O._10N.286.46.C4]|nr:P-loop containing nucleoside triphosphate hydrolase [Vibrio phage 1.121.O._10N.286.46.C4]
MDYEEVDSYWIHNEYCIADELIEKGSKRELRSCGSSDAMGIYENEPADGEVYYTGYCRSCSQPFNKKEMHSSSHATELGVVEEGGEVTERKKFERKPKQPKITRDQMKEVLSHGYRSKNIRGIRDEINQFFGHVTKLGRDGKPRVRFYPETNDTGLMGYKSRTFPKGFGYENYGITGVKNHLSGQAKFQDMHFRDICIVGGEEDKAAFYQQFSDYQEERYSKVSKEYAVMPVVSPTTGEGSAYNQVKANYDFVNRAERIYIGLDNDKAGWEGAEKIANLFPAEKVFIIYWTYKDPNAAIDNPEGKDYSAQSIRDFFNAKPYKASTVKSSKRLRDAIRMVLLKKRITLPSYMDKISKMMGGDSGEMGMLQNVIVNVIGNTSVGKSSHVNGMVHHWIMNSPQKPVIASLEATDGQYALEMVSIHLGENVRKGRSGEEVLEYLDTPEVQERLADLWENEWGEERFQIIDERDGSLKSLEKQLETAFYRDGCGLMVIDVLTDVLRNLSIEEQSDHMSWQKNMVKNGATIVNVLHTTKPKRDSKGNMIPITEYDAYGSSTFVQSAAINILIDRDKMIEDPIERNTTRVRMPKCREGHTGDAGEWYYDVGTRKVYDRDRYFRDNPDKLPAGYDLKANPYAQEEEKPFSKKAGGSRKQEPVGNQDDIMDDIPI